MSTSPSPYKKTALVISATLALGLGGAALHNQYGAEAQSTQTTAAPTTLAQTTQPFNAARAKTENERNTVDVVRSASDGLVYISVQSGTKPTTTSPTRPRSGQSGTPNGNQANPNSGNQNGDSQNGDSTDPFAGTPFQGLPFNFGQSSPNMQPTPQRGTGSGFFVNAKGDILTNYHVVDGADTITIRVHNHPETYTAKVIGTAPDYDLALIRADDLPQNLIKPIPLGDSDALEPGLKAVALGAPFDLDFSVTEGIISATARKIPVGMRGVNQSVIQTDAAINPGNSGGPLLGSDGQVIGINTQILTGGSDQNAGVGFAIPVNVAKTLLPRLEAGSKITTPVLGLRYADLSALDPATLKSLNLPTQGALVISVEPGSPAEKAGLKAGKQQITLQDGTPLTLGGDVITSVDGQALNQTNTLQSTIFGKSVGDTVKLNVERGNQKLDLNVKLSEFQPQASSRN